MIYRKAMLMQRPVGGNKASFLLAELANPTPESGYEKNYLEKGSKDWIQTVNETIPINQNELDNTPQKQLIHSFISLDLIGTSNNSVPLWMRSRQFGSIPLSGLSASFIGGIQKSYDPNRISKLIDWGASAEARVNEGTTNEAILIEAYLKARLGILQLKAGRSKEFMGLVDSTLSSGAFAVSGNALGIPKIELSIPEYWSLPYTNDLIAIKGNFAHGWMGDQTIIPDIFYGKPFLTNHVVSYFHQASVYGRLGKPGWRLKFYGGVNHEVMWGNESEIFPGFGLSKTKDFLYVITGKTYGLLTSKVGNHIGSIDQGFEIRLKNNNLITGYHQFFYDISALLYLANVTDGLWGLSFQNTKPYDNRFKWKKILVEFLNSKSQGGKPGSVVRPDGAEDYYNNYLYQKGWTYLDENIGNPLLTSKKYMRPGLPQLAKQYYPNNRVMAFHTGMEFVCSQWSCKALLSYSANFGTWQTTPVTQGEHGVIQHNPPPYFGQVGQFSGYLEANRPLKNGYSLGFVLAADQGELLNNSFGGSLKITKTW